MTNDFGKKSIEDITYQILTPNKIATEVQEAFNQWQGICSENNNVNCKPCKLRVIFSQERQRFINPADGLPSIPGIMESFIRDKSSEDCLTCGQDGYNEIVLNGVYSTDFSLELQYSFWTEYPSDIPPLHKSLTRNFFDVRTVVAHEIGHYLGLAHTSDIPNCVGDNSSVMTPTTPNKRVLPSAIDKCAIYKLHCCPETQKRALLAGVECCPLPTSVDEFTGKDILQVHITPNPTSEQIAVQIANIPPSNLPLYVALFDNQGRFIRELNPTLSMPQNGRFEAPSSVAELATGTYFVIVKIGSYKQTTSFVKL